MGTGHRGNRLNWNRGKRLQPAGLKRSAFREGNEVVMVSATSFHPAGGIAGAIRESMDPSRPHGKVRTLADMSEAERARMLELYAPPKPKGGKP